MEFDISPHLLSTISYKIPVGQAAVEPHVMYRDILGGKKLKKGKIDLSLRGHFLEERLWLGVGTRLNKAAYNFSIGVQVIDNLFMQAFLETHNSLGEYLGDGSGISFWKNKRNGY